MLKAFFLIAMFLIGLASMTTHAFSKEPLHLAIFPRHPPAETTKMFSPLVSYLSQQLQRDVILHTPADFFSFWENIKQNKYDLVHYNQYHYIKAHKLYQHNVLVKNEENGRSDIRSIILVPASSPITNIKQLKGKKILFGGGRGAMVSYIMASNILRNAGLKEGDYLIQFTQNPAESFKNLYYGLSDAASASDLSFNNTDMPWFKYGETPRIIAQSEALTHLPWAATSNMSDKLAQKIKKVLLHLNHTTAGNNILKQAKLSGLRDVKDADYNPHRKIVSRILKENY